MTTYNRFGDRNRDSQDGIERHIWGSLKYENNAGAYIDVEGTGTKDYDIGVINVGYGFNLTDNTNAEVMVVADGSDTNQKYGFLTLPRDKQRQWRQNTGGIQHPLNPERAVEFNDKRTHIIDERIAFGKNGLIELNDDGIIFRGNLIVEGDLTIAGGLKVAGDIKSNGNAVFNGDVSTSFLHTPLSDRYNKTTNVVVNIPPFEA